MSENVSVDMSQYFYRVSAADFMKIPGSPIAYWANENVISLFERKPSLSKKFPVKSGIMTGNDSLYLRFWHEVSHIKTSFGLTHSDQMNNHWYPLSKGGEYRKWYGNNEHIINLKNDGYDIKNGGTNHRLRDPSLYFQPYLTWSRISSSLISFRYLESGVLFADAAPGIFSGDNCLSVIALLNSKFCNYFLTILNPTLNYQTVDIERLPTVIFKENIIIKNAIDISKNDWDSYETSWDFSSLPLLAKDTKQPTLEASYKTLRDNWLASTLEMQRLEEENNRIFIDAYGLQDELTPEVPLNEITLTCNPHYRYRGDLTEQEREDRLQSDTIAELISYAIGCMMGRYSLDREGLVYAHENNDGFAELVAEGAYKSFPADDDGILALTAEEWFEDDIANRFSEFLAQVWGEDSLQQNIDFVAQSLCLYALKARSGETSIEVIRRYLSTQFFKDHMNMYKRRPIYWLFSSGKHKAFECLVYLHRYNESTLARMRTEYVIPHTARLSAYATRLAARIEAADSTAERNRLNREQKKIHDQQAELAAFDEQLRHAADQRIQLDLDDGVKVNYGKFGNLLAEVKAIAG